jgi:Spy/CpxP family protein refolding chaperone
MKNVIAVAAIAAAALLSPAAVAATAVDSGTDLAAMRTAMKTDKRGYVAAQLQLTPDEEKKFWPVYDTYQRQLDAIGTRRAELIEQLVTQSKPMSDRYAKMVIHDADVIEEQESKATRQMVKSVQKALPALKAARYIQIEQKMHAVQAYDIASVMPFVK